MQLDVEESTPASDMTYWFNSRIAILNCHHATVKSQQWSGKRAKENYNMVMNNF